MISVPISLVPQTKIRDETMNLYLIVPIPPMDSTGKLADTIQQRFGSHAYRLPGGEWLIAFLMSNLFDIFAR